MSLSANLCQSQQPSSLLQPTHTNLAAQRDPQFYHTRYTIALRCSIRSDPRQAGHHTHPPAKR